MFKCRILHWNHLILGFSLLGGFWLLIQSPYLLLFCSDFLFLNDSVLLGYVLQGMYSFLLGYPNLLVYDYLGTVVIIFISVTVYVMSPLLFFILVTWVFYFAVVNLAKTMSINWFLTVKTGCLIFFSIFIFLFSTLLISIISHFAYL